MVCLCGLMWLGVGCLGRLGFGGLLSGRWLMPRSRVARRGPTRFRTLVGVRSAAPAEQPGRAVEQALEAAGIARERPSDERAAPAEQPQTFGGVSVVTSEEVPRGRVVVGCASPASSDLPVPDL